MLLAIKILIWYLALGLMFYFTMADKIEIIIGALRLHYQYDEKKNLSEKHWRKFITILFIAIWPIFVINILRKRI